MRTPVIPLALLACCSYVLRAQNPIPDPALMERLHQNAPLYADRDKGESLRARADRNSGDASIKVEQMENYFVDSQSTPIDPANDPLVKAATSHSDIVALGKAVRIMSELTPNEAFVFSDAQFLVNAVWYQSSDNSKTVGDVSGKEITVTFPGGTAQVDGHKLAVELSSEPPLVLGHTYLLFLKYLPESHSYKMIDFKGFDLTSTQAHTLYRNPERDSRAIMLDKTAFLQAMQSSVNRAKLGERK